MDPAELSAPLSSKRRLFLSLSPPHTAVAHAFGRWPRLPRSHPLQVSWWRRRCLVKRCSSDCEQGMQSDLSTSSSTRAQVLRRASRLEASLRERGWLQSTIEQPLERRAAKVCICGARLTSHVHFILRAHHAYSLTSCLPPIPRATFVRNGQLRRVKPREVFSDATMLSTSLGLAN